MLGDEDEEEEEEMGQVSTVDPPEETKGLALTSARTANAYAYNLEMELGKSTTIPFS